MSSSARLPRRRSAISDVGEVEHRRDRVPDPERPVERDADRLVHREPAEQPGVLERTREPELGAPLRPQPRDVAAVERGSSPESGTRNPEMRSKSVVLPAPFGPTMPRISPSWSWMDTSSTAVMPAKRSGQVACLEHDAAFAVRARRGRGSRSAISASGSRPCSRLSPVFAAFGGGRRPRGRSSAGGRGARAARR